MTCGRPRSDRVTIRRKILENEWKLWGGREVAGGVRSDFNDEALSV